MNFDPKVTAMQAAVFGPRPFGLNLTLVVVLAGFAYVVALMAAWLAVASHVGV